VGRHFIYRAFVLLDMSLSDKLPLVADRSTPWKVGVAVLYAVTFPFWLTLLPLIAGLFVWQNFYGWAEGLDRLPGIGADGGLVAGGAAFVYVFVLLGVIGAVLGGGEDGGSGQQAAAGGGGGAAETPVIETAAPTATPASPPTPIPTATPTPTSTATPTPEPTPEPIKVSTPTPTPEPVDTLEIRVQYDGDWQGSLSVTGDGDSTTRSVDGSGTTTIEIEETSVQILSANAQKQDDSEATLTIQILRNGDVVAESSTDAEYGLAQVSKSFF